MTIELIESKIKIMNDDSFHRFCDHFLYFNEGKDYESINPVGQAEGKQKSRGGTPDTKIKLKSDQYIFIQYTTQDNFKRRTDFLNKLKEDLEACFDYRKTRTPLTKIKRVVLCFNSNIDNETEATLIEIVRSKRISLKLVNLSTIAHRVYKYFPFLAKDYLGIEVDTYQLLPLRKFVEEYEKGGLATPLSNPFQLREEEFKQAETSVAENLITVISGKAGVGKSRLAVEVVRKFNTKNKKYIGYCIKNKDLPVIFDLRRNLTDAKSYLIYIDDANKSIGHLKDVLSFYQENNIEFKIILTVREYVLKDILPFIHGYSHKVVNVNLFEPDQIKKIITEKPFNIKNSHYQRRISEVAKGNPRLAIMMAIAAQTKELNELNNVFDIYDAYFDRVSGDNPLLFDKHYLMVLGVLAFFRVIDRDNREACEKIFKAFKLDESDFWTKVYNLERYELVDVFTDGASVKFTDQILEGYLFYKTFFIDNLLNYKLVLDDFFHDYKGRVSYTAIDANNAFGFHEFGDKIKPFIQAKYQSLTNAGEDATEFLKIFWFHLQDETLLYCKRQIDLLMPSTKLILMDKITDVRFNQKTFSFQGDLTLNGDVNDALFDLISEFLKYELHDFNVAIELLFMYVARKQELGEKLVSFTRSNFSFTQSDEMYNYYREEHFSRYLAGKANQGEPIFKYVFLKLVPHFLKSRFDASYSQNMKIHIAYIEPSATDKIKEIRKIYWETFRAIYKEYPALSLFTMKAILDTFEPDFHASLRKSDWPFLEQIFQDCFDPATFLDAYVMNQYIDRMQRRKVERSLVKNVKIRASTKEYRWFLTLDWNLLRNKERWEDGGQSSDNWQAKFDELKKAEIISAFNFKTGKEYVQLFHFIGECMNLQLWDGYNVARSTDILLTHILESTDLINDIVSEIITRPYFGLIFRFDHFFSTIQQKSPELLNKVEQILLSNEFENKQWVLLGFYDNLASENINEARATAYFDLLNQLKGGRFHLYFSNITRYLTINPNFLFDAIPLLLTRSKNGECEISLDRNFIQNHFDHIKKKIKMAEEVYLYLENKDHFYDFQGAELEFLLDRDSTFLNRYLDFLVDEKRTTSEERHQLGIIWKQKNYISLIEMAFLNLSKADYKHYRAISVLEDMFDNRTPVADFEIKKLAFFNEFIRSHPKDVKLLKIAFRIISGKVDGHFNELLIQFLRQNNDINLFKKINWTDQGIIVRNGHSNLGEIEERIWVRIKNVIADIEPRMDYLEHKSYVNLKIDQARKMAVSERRWDFLRGA